MTRWPLVMIVLVFELGLLGIGTLWISWRTPPSPLFFSPNGWRADFSVGLLTALPLLVGFLLVDRVPLGWCRRLAAVMKQSVAPIFEDCSVAELALVSMAAGLGEEIFFRGALQTGLAEMVGGPWGPILAVASVAVVFGALHWITAAYAICAGLAGAYLGVVLIFCESLCVPIVAHASYDFAALVILVHRARTKKNGPSGDEGPLGCTW